MILAHIAGVPFEETLLAFAPVGVAGVGAWVAQLRYGVRRSRTRNSSWLCWRSSSSNGRSR
jgi:predicted alpha/beta-hydrolase family hydrolase